MMRKIVQLGVLLFAFGMFSFGSSKAIRVKGSEHDLKFSALSTSWDEGIPLGNGVVGALIWKKDSFLRMSLDRVDLWDLRPFDSISGVNNRFKWVYEQVQKGDYSPVQRKYDEPYEREPASSKIPGAGLEFNIAQMGEVENVRLYLTNAVCEVVWKNGAKMHSFVHATQPVGWFRIEGVADHFVPELKPPVYNQEGEIADANSVDGQDLRRLGYEQGKVTRGDHKQVYHQKGWGDFYYDVAVKWKKQGRVVVGVWSVTSSLSGENAEEIADKAFDRGFVSDYLQHLTFWDDYWAQSSIELPDRVLEKQYFNEMYKWGSAARENSYPISLQSVWTADNGKLPPWKGDYHHDLNTQLSYWPCYTGNHLAEGLGYLNTLWEQREVNRRYTKQYFETEGLNVPGVCTLEGVPMGGWIQYSMSPTVSAWLSQHFYLHWKYSQDRDFLKERAYPYVKEVVTFLEQFTVVDENGVRKLPLSSSPEIHDNSINAWFKDMTNYDLALVRFAFKMASELASELSLSQEAAHWKSVLNEFPDFDVDSHGGLTFAPGFPYRQSHRHFSNSMAIHPLGLIDWSNGEKDQKIIKATIDNLEKSGPNYWVGYSYSWFGNLKARAFDGEGAAKELRTFAECFCLKNTFHANGDQTKSGKSLFTYRPFTLEGNFAFAAGVQEMLMQSHTGVIRLFPAIPKGWQEASFTKLRGMGAFLVSARLKEGQVAEVEIYAEKGGVLRMVDPFGGPFEMVGNTTALKQAKEVIEVETKAGQTIKLINAHSVR